MNTEKAILSQLNESQQLAVKQIDGPVMVIAGAGSGKTRVLTYRIAFMLSKGINPFQILALTFTNKAAKEMKERIFKLVDNSNAKAVVMGTFHSVFYRILRIEGIKLGYTNNLTVYDTDDSKGILRSIIKEMNLDSKVYLLNFVMNRISAAKSSLLSPEDYAQTPEIIEADTASGKPLIYEIFKRYNQRLKKADAMDFDDLLFYMNVLLRDFPEMLYKYQNRFRYILVDEYQDINFAQYLIIKKLSSAHQNLCVVGDDAQSIYSFRGADIQNILNFKRDYPAAYIVKLEQNYRSTKNIVNAANAIIKNNKEQLYKEVWTNNTEGNRINIFKSNSDSDEAQTIANLIFETKVNYQVSNKQFAILYRTNSQSRSLEEALIKRQIPYKIYGGLSFYKRKEIKDLLAYFRLAINHYDEESLRRVINYPLRGIGSTTFDKIVLCAQQQETRLWNVIECPNDYLLDVNSSIKNKLNDFTNQIRSYTAMIQTTDAYELGRHIATSTGIVKALKEDISEKERLDNIHELLDAMKAFTEAEPETSFNPETGEIINEFFPTLDRFMENVALLTNDDENEPENDDKVKLMTIHASKGLEFDYVFVSGMEENLFPSSLCINTRKELEEERRLFYVAITRAKVMLTLTHAQMRYRFGSLQYCEPSRFLEEIPTKFINFTQKASSQKGKQFQQKSHYLPEESSILSKYTNKKVTVKTKSTIEIEKFGVPALPSQILPGVKIYHEKFGYGIVKNIDGKNLDAKATVAFDTVGTKTLILHYAKLIIPHENS